MRLAVHPDVAAALAARRPVVALESTVIAHGLPRPRNLETARALEDEVRGLGATPATIALANGEAVVGADAALLERLARDDAVAKVSLRDLAPILARRALGATTVAASVEIAARAGIAVLATGGIGGVHRAAATTGDVSADLIALARLPVAVVCAGAKAVLDLPRTREALETLGVPVLGFGSDRFPAFYRRDGGLSVDARFDRVLDLATAVKAHFALASGSGAVVANPVPPEHELSTEPYEKGIAQALSDAERVGVTGRDITPFLLERLRELTGGRSVATNRALLLNNARLAAQLARELRRA